MARMVSQEARAPLVAVRRVWSAAGLVVALLTGPLLALPQEDQQLLEFLLKELRYYDTALRYLDGIEKSRRLDDASQAEVLALRIEAYDGLGDQPSKLKVIDELKKRFPNHPRALGGDILVIRDNLRRVLAKYDQALVEPDAEKAEKLRAEGAAMFADLVEKPLSATLADIEGKIAELKKKLASTEAAGTPKPQEKGRRPRQKPTTSKSSPELDALLLSRDQTELARIGMYLAYAEKLAEGSKPRQEILEKGLKLATQFVDVRTDFPVMRYQGQLQVGILLFTLGRHAEAESSLSLLYNIAPPDAAKPFGKPLVDAFKALRLQSLLFGARSMNSAGNYKKAVEIVEQFFLKAPRDEFYVSIDDPSSDLRPIVVLLRLEHAVALAGAGEARKGLEEVQKVIDKYKALGGQGAAFVIDARKALGRIAQMGVPLRSRDYYEAGLGLKSELKFDQALTAFQKALGKLTPRNGKDFESLAPLCLNEIGEALLAQKRWPEAAIVYGEIAQTFADLDPGLVGKVAQNFLGASTRATATTPNGTAHAGLKKLKAEATKYSEDRSGSLGVQQVKLFDARNYEDQGKLEDARKEYLKVPREYNRQRVPFYWFAQAKAWTCLYYLWDQADEQGKAALESDIAQAAMELPKIVRSAKAEKDELGYTTASLTLGLIHYEKGSFDEAIEALKIFADASSASAAVRCAGLYSLILAEAYGGKREEAGAHFALLEKDCQQGVPLSGAAKAIADGYEEAGDLPNAAKWTLTFAKLPSSRSELERIETLVEVIRRLIEGGLIQESAEFVAMAKRSAPADDPRLSRQLAYLDAKVPAYHKKWDEVVAKLKSYHTKFGLEGQYYEDPYVAHDLAEAYLARSKPKKTPLDDITSADDYYNLAFSRMEERRTQDVANEKLFWRWGLKFFRVHMRVGEAGNTNAYVHIIEFVDKREESEKGDFGGLKEEFLKLRAEARAKLGKS
jgi:hypothetical protein